MENCRGARASEVAGVLPASVLTAPDELAHALLLDYATPACATATVDHADRFLGDAIHEFRTPSTVIREFASLCLEGVGGPLTDKQEEYLHYIEMAAERLGEDFVDYRDAVRLESGAQRPAADRAPLMDIVASAVQGEGVMLIGDVYDADAVDPVGTERALGRLIAAGRKWTRSDARIRVAVTAGDGADRVTLTVEFSGLEPVDVDIAVLRDGVVDSDTGPYRSVARVFGVGVAMVRLWAAEVGGEVRLRRTDGGGVFALELPECAYLALGT